MTNRIALTLGLVLAGATAVAATAASADIYRGKGVNARQSNQHARINAGIRNGSLTRLEAARLRAEQRRIVRYERQARADGHLSRGERLTLQRMQIRASQKIHHQRHDWQKRRWFR
ncbi:MAG: hypothetical protein AB7O43_05695 [Hyphomicrobiaceae bacterium]